MPPANLGHTGVSDTIELDHLTRDFGHFRAVDDIALTIGKGEVLGFLGPNGAGKSTTMRMLAGFLPPTAGTARILGHDVQTDSIAARRALGFLPEGAPTYPEMSVIGFLRFVARVRGYRGETLDTRVEDAMALTQLGSVRLQTIETLSKGYKRRVGLAQALLHDPPALVLDEPTDGLDPNQKHEVRSSFAAWRRIKRSSSARIFWRRWRRSAPARSLSHPAVSLWMTRPRSLRRAIPPAGSKTCSAP